MRLQVFRHAAYRTPWWLGPSAYPGRFHKAGGQTVQYLSRHPLGPAAEMLRHAFFNGGDPNDLKLNLWTAVLEIDTYVRVHFDNCESDHGITPEQLIGDDYEPTQNLAESVAGTGVQAMFVPSAALPGTDNVVLFGRRLSADYLTEPLSEVEIPTGHLSDEAHAPRELILQGLLCRFGETHHGLDRWREAKEIFVFQDPEGAMAQA
jgi:hypothetical protein